MKVARIYIRVSTDDQGLTRQRTLIEKAKEQGYYVAKVYSEKTPVLWPIALLLKR